MIIGNETSRPRNVDAPRAAAILYGDWGTSKAYVIGLAFAVAGYASFWLIAAMCLLTGLVGLNYIVICKHYPRRRRRVRQRAAPFGGHQHRRRVPVDRGLHRYGGDLGAVRLSIPRHPTPGDFRGGSHRGHRRAESPRPQAHGRAGRGHLGPHGGRRADPGRVRRPASRRGVSQRPSAHRRPRQELERVRLHRAGALGRGGHRQRHGRDEARSRQHPRQAERYQDGDPPPSCGWLWKYVSSPPCWV